MSQWDEYTQTNLNELEVRLSEGHIPLTYDAPTLFKLIRGWQRVALREAAHTMPIDTLFGADGASVWLHDYADRFGDKP